MDSKLWCTILTILLIIAIKESEGIQCYVCYGKNCGDPFNSFNISLTECISGTFWKVKAIQNGNQIVERSCSPLYSDKSYCQSENVKGVSGTGCVCNTDKCNTATYTATSVLVLISLVLWRVIRHLFL